MQPPAPFILGTKKAPAQQPVQVIGSLGIPPVESHNHFYGYTTAQAVIYDDVNAFTWFSVAPLDVPVRVNLAEQIGPTIVDSDIAFTYLYVSPVDVGLEHSLSPETKPDLPFRTFWVTGRSDEDGLINYTGGTAINRMAHTPAPEIKKAGPFTPKQVLEEILTDWKSAGHDWLRWRPLPEIMLQTADGPIIPSIDAIVVLQSKDPGNEPKAMLRVIEDFLAPFPGYFLHVDPQGYLELVRPAWAASNAFSDDFLTINDSASIPITGSPAKVEVVLTAKLFKNWTVYRQFISSIDTNTYTLEDGDSIQLNYQADTGDGQASFTVQMSYSSGTLTFTLTALTDPSTLPYVHYFLRLEGQVYDDSSTVTLTSDQITADEQVQVLTDQVVNICQVRSKGYSFNTQTDVMEPAAGIMKTKFPCWSGEVCVTPNHDTVFGNTGRYDLGTGPCVPGTMGDHPEAVLPKLWKVQDQYLLGSDEVQVAAQVLWYWDQCGDTTGPGYVGDSDNSGNLGTVHTNIDDWQLATEVERSSSQRNIKCQVWLKPSYDDGAFIGFQVKLKIVGAWNGAFGVGVRLNGDGTAFTENTDSTFAEFGEQSGDPEIEASIATYGRRVKTIDMGPWPVDADTALKIAQAVVEQSASPHREYTIRIMPPYTAANAYNIGAGVRYEDVRGIISAWRYTENHSPNRSRSSLSLRIREIERITSGDMENTAYGEAVYGVSKYLE